MEKISSIVPRSRRVSSVDLASAPAVRPGAPSFGRPMGTSTTGIKDNLTTAERAMVEFDHVNDTRKKSTNSPEVVEQLTNAFFMKKTTEAPRPDLKEQVEIENPAVKLKAQGQGEAEETEPEVIIEAEAPREYVPPGTYLNLTA